MRISACIIAKNEIDRITACIESVRFLDEVVVLDSGSTDGTPEACRRLGARVIETGWPGYIEQKNRAADAAANDWVFSLDADERVDAGLRADIERVRSAHPGGPADVAAYEVPRKVHALGRWIRHGGWYPEWRARLFHRRQGRWGGMDPHDRFETRGKVVRLSGGHLEHHTWRSLEDYLGKLNQFSSVAAREMLARGRRAGFAALVLRPAFRFVRMYFFRLGFLDGWAGFQLARLDAFGAFLKYAKLRELRRRAPPVSGGGG
jgi:glycosyltransferase involved in cell wall biosynthesis